MCIALIEKKKTTTTTLLLQPLFRRTPYTHPMVKVSLSSYRDRELQMSQTLAGSSALDVSLAELYRCMQLFRVFYWNIFSLPIMMQFQVERDVLVDIAMFK